MNEHDRWAAYRAAHIGIEVSGVGTIVVRPERPGVARGRFPVDDGSTVHVITAHNPGGVVTNDAVNDVAHAYLLALLGRREGLMTWPAVGGDPEWCHRETSVAVVGLTDEDACGIGRDLGQDAVFAWTPTALIVLACDGPGSHTSGWSVSADNSDLSVVAGCSGNKGE